MWAPRQHCPTQLWSSSCKRVRHHGRVCRYALPWSYHLPTQLVCVLIIAAHTPRRCAAELRSVPGAAEYFQLTARDTNTAVHAVRYSLLPLFWVS